MKTIKYLILIISFPLINSNLSATGKESPENAPEKTQKSHSDYRFNSFDFNVDFGINNYLNDGNFPDENGSIYAVRPWGSWYVALTGTQTTKIAGPLYLKLGAFVDWYNFKFLNENTRLTTNGQEVAFFEINDPLINSQKSKLTLSYLNLKAVPTIYLGKNKHSSGGCGFLDWDNRPGAIRIGAGGYVGYRLDAYAKAQYKIEGDKEKERIRENYFTNNLRYGVRFELGVGSFDFFLNYDMNDLFVENRGPQLNPISFGLTL
mgnify:CR=1 FL=1